MERQRIDGWLERYRRAWKTDDRREIDALFSDDVRYYNAPFGEPLCGHDEVADYWIGERESAIPWTFEAEPIAQEGDLFVVRAVTTYPEGTSDAEGPETFHNLWLVTLDDHGRAREFVEYFMLAR